MAAEANVTKRTMHNALHRHRIPLPSQARYAHVDLDAVFDAYRAGEQVARIAAR
jgi:hypothetical protein